MLWSSNFRLPSSFEFGPLVIILCLSSLIMGWNGVGLRGKDSKGLDWYFVIWLSALAKGDIWFHHESWHICLLLRLTSTEMTCMGMYCKPFFIEKLLNALPPPKPLCFLSLAYQGFPGCKQFGANLEHSLLILSLRAPLASSSFFSDPPQDCEEMKSLLLKG